MSSKAVSLALAGLAAAFVPQPAAADSGAALPVLVGVVFNVADPERELAFYREVFGMTLAVTLDHGTTREYILGFAGAGAAPALVLQHDTAKVSRAKRARGDAFNRLVLRVTDMTALIARLDSRKQAHTIPRSDPKGYQVLHTADPEGFALEVIQVAAQAPPSAQ